MIPGEAELPFHVIYRVMSMHANAHCVPIPRLCVAHMLSFAMHQVTAPDQTGAEGGSSRAQGPCRPAM